MAISVIANKKYFIKSYAKSGSTGQYLNIWGTSFTGNMQHVKTYTKVASDPMQKWFFGENPETGCFIRTECNSAYAINMNSVSNPICTMYTAVGNDTDAKVKLIPVNDSKRVYYIYLVNRNLYLTATGEATGSACKWQAKNSSDSELQQWQFEPVDGATPPTPSGNYLTYPCTVMNISQRHDGTFSHSPNSTGYPSDYPIDEICENTGRTYMYCPCDQMEVLNVYGVGTTGVNTIWLRSTSPVITPSGTDYIVMMVTHPEDDDLSQISVGQKFTRGQAMFREGSDGLMSTGNHFHISVGKGNVTGNGWTQNNNSAWVLTTTNGNLLPTQAFYIKNSFTQVVSSNGYNFATI